MNKQTYSAALLMIVLGFIIGAGSFVVSHQGKSDTQNQDLTYAETWKTYESKKDGYTIKYPEGFHVDNDRTLQNFETKAYDKASTTQIVIQVNKVPYSGFVQKATFSDDVKKFYPKSKNVPNLEQVNIGKFITQTHFVSNIVPGADGTVFYSMNSEDFFYSIVVYEPGYSHNKELVENILRTFSFTE